MDIMVIISYLEGGLPFKFFYYSGSWKFLIESKTEENLTFTLC